MSLCRVCFNPEDTCECETFSPGSATSLVNRSAPIPASTADRIELVAGVVAARQPHLVRFLDAIESMRCYMERPPAVAQDYVNVRPPSTFGEERLCAITRSTGRIEFQTNTWFIAEDVAPDAVVDHLAAGDKAAMNLVDEAQADAAVAIAKAVLSSRRASG